MREFRKALVNKPMKNISLKNILTLGRPGHIRLIGFVIYGAISATLILAACAPYVLPQPVEVQNNTPTFTETAPATDTATPIATPDATATKEVGYKVITADNFMEAYKDKSCFIDLENDIFSGKYKEWRNTQKGTYDAFKLNNLPMFRYPDLYGNGAIAFHFSGKPNFDEKPAPMNNFILACTTFEGRNYLLNTPEITQRDHKSRDPHNLNGDEVIALQAVYPLFNVNTGADLTEAEVTQIIDLLSKMKVIPLLTSTVPEWSTTPDPLITESWKNFPDMERRFKSFAGEVDARNHYQELDDPKLIVLTAIDALPNGDPDPASQ